jgi:ribose 5-phosphate isomerase A
VQPDQRSAKSGASSRSTPPLSAGTQTVWKREAAEAAVADAPDGAILGLGSGSTAELMLQELAERVRKGLRVTGVPTSERTRQIAASLGIPLADLDDVAALDMSIDGADEVLLPQLDLVKGHGGALLHEKLIASASRFRVIIVDASKIVTGLGTRAPIPVEVTPFGWRHTAARLAALGAQPVRRGGDAPFITDGGNYILDCAVAPIVNPAALAQAIKAIVGVVDHGLFIGMTERVYIAGADGVRRVERPR